MNIYFAVSDKMIEDRGMSERLETQTYQWSLYSQGRFGGSFLAAYIGQSAGDVMNAMRDFNINEPFTICRAQVKDTDLIEGLRSALVGDTIHEVKVVINELIRVQ